MKDIIELEIVLDDKNIGICLLFFFMNNEMKIKKITDTFFYRVK